ncbi:hypothetical protein METSCH_B03450 [Metschnikowia aff. pulcherrima]|uniref:Uncharacterized protein n=1 Tax=Metschnikowia aff. pulcherrima TaxID=2163413 RepID=A0A4P6XLR4_9ASCO|nr:hypothetical protein METSCH_B03450 [Metschnikowia aff. pulcherrima]
MPYNAAMEFMRGPYLHPPWIFTWWSKQTDEKPQHPELPRVSKRERIRHYIQYKIPYGSEFFRRKTSRLFRREYAFRKPELVASESGSCSLSKPRSEGYKIMIPSRIIETLQNQAKSRSLITEPRNGSAATQDDRLTPKSLADTSETRSLLKKIRLQWLNSSEIMPPRSTADLKKMMPQSISFLKEMCPGPSTTEVSAAPRLAHPQV